ncbi:DNA-methyltransferase [Candidatus Synechococcus spongiarum]|uniref:Type III restriction-modification system methylation subunit n=1 Tax=Candidatus Synechococcus spongiarum TaxID=431041 RepID=A0A171DHY1_9SYNE|nr:site-specific DNA-methyltransferase [Candidatus Synechococcus spongiarum]SAY39443.1 Type III restriction-modification system methylation subunit (EC 2.1.1.72) [Candidatus Synechococcus spongiarum]
MNKATGPVEGDFIAPPEIEEQGESSLPQQEEFWRPPVRFGSVPVEKEPLGWDRRQGFHKLFPRVMLPFQVVERVHFGHGELEPNRLFWGDNLHVMRQLPSESIDLIYIDPPFFSGRDYNVIFGDQNERRSFSDIWEDGMPGYLIWLNARLFEMKRLLKKTGSILVHCDWHASHYIKVEMDKIFGHKSFINEIVWCYKSGGASPKRYFSRKHDTIFFYVLNNSYYYESQQEKSYNRGLKPYRFSGVTEYQDSHGWHTLVGMKDYWEIDMVGRTSAERIGYPTQKPEKLLTRVINSCSPIGGVVADFFCGGGTTAAVAQRLGRRWITCDQSRVAVAVTRDRLTGQVEQQTGAVLPVPDFTVENWGIYEAQRLAQAPPDQFRAFVLRCFGARIEQQDESIHGTKGSVPVWVGGSGIDTAVTEADVSTFANAIRRTLRYQQDNLRDGLMLAWAFAPGACEAAERLRVLEQTDVNFIRLEQVRIDSSRFREHVTALSTNHADYENFLTFIQPPRVEVGYRRVSPLTYIFDVSETAVMNSGARIINVQWDFSHGQLFSSTKGYSFTANKKKGPKLQVKFKFSQSGKRRIACRVQDDLGGDGLKVIEIEVN